MSSSHRLLALICRRKPCLSKSTVRFCILSAARNVSFKSWALKGEGSHETSLVGQCCDLLLPTDRRERQCKRFLRRQSIGRIFRAHDSPYFSRYFWRLC